MPVNFRLTVERQGRNLVNSSNMIAKLVQVILIKNDKEVAKINV